MSSFVTAATGNEFNMGAGGEVHRSQLLGAASRTERVKNGVEGANGIRADVNV